MIYGEGATQTGGRALVWVDRTGRAEPVDPDMERGGYNTVTLSRDNDRIAVTATGLEQDAVAP